MTGRLRCSDGHGTRGSERALQMVLQKTRSGCPQSKSGPVERPCNPLMVLRINPIHFGVLMTLNLMLGLLTPPVGLVLYAMSSVARVPMMVLAKELLPFLASLFMMLALITAVPALVTWLPGMVMGAGK